MYMQLSENLLHFVIPTEKRLDDHTDKQMDERRMPVQNPWDRLERTTLNVIHHFGPNCRAREIFTPSPPFLTHLALSLFRFRSLSRNHANYLTRAKRSRLLLRDFISFSNFASPD